jgi:hypothetical protein
MSVNLLSDNQKRRLASHLGLLVDDLGALAAAPALQSHPRLARLVDDAVQGAQALRADLGLPAERGPSLRRRVAATAEVWAVRVDDLRAHRMRGYGPVHPELADLLDPRLEAMRKILLALADAASELPEQDP